MVSCMAAILLLRLAASECAETVDGDVADIDGAPLRKSGGELEWAIADDATLLLVCLLRCRGTALYSAVRIASFIFSIHLSTINCT